MRAVLRALTVGAVVSACGPPGSRPAADREAAEAVEHQTHDAYVTAINSNDRDSILAMLTEDVVYLYPHAPVMVGKPAVRQWVDEYVKAFTTHWGKTALEFVVAGEWAFERYAYKATDTPRGGGAVIQDTGWGLVIYHHDRDGKWRVARDAWGTDRPLPAK